MRSCLHYKSYRWKLLYFTVIQVHYQTETHFFFFKQRKIVFHFIFYSKFFRRLEANSKRKLWRFSVLNRYFSRINFKEIYTYI